MKIELTDDFKYRMLDRYPELAAAADAIFSIMGLTIEDIRGRRRYRDYVYARIIFTHLCERVYPHQNLAVYMDHTHSVVSYWGKVFKDMKKYDKDFNVLYADIEREFNKKMKQNGVF